MISWCELVPGCTYLKSAEYDLSYCEEQILDCLADNCAAHLWRISRALETIYILSARKANRAGHRLEALRLSKKAQAERERRQVCAG